MVKGTTKGESTAEDLTNGVYQLGDVDENYTGDIVVETAGTGGKLMFTPIDRGFYDKETETWYKFRKDDGTFSNTDPSEGDKVAYKYDNVVIPQETLPTLKAELKNIGLEAHARRIAVFYSQMAAFQAEFI